MPARKYFTCTIPGIALVNIALVAYRGMHWQRNKKVLILNAPQLSVSCIGKRWIHKNYL